MRIIDTHQHLLYPDRFGYAWSKGIPALAGRQFRLEEYRVAAAGTGIAKTLFMEVDVDEPQMKSESEFFLQLAARPESGIAGVIAACRPEREDFPAYLESMVDPGLKGLRRILHNQPDPLSQTPLFSGNLVRLASRDLTFDLCLLARQLPLAKTILQRTPGVQFVLDHCGIPNIEEQSLDPWRRDIRELAQWPNLACKISGVIAYGGSRPVSVELLRPFIEHVLECFGWDRVVFGGDWPVCNITASLGRWVELAKEIVSQESRINQEKFFAKNAERIYRLYE